MATGLAMRRGGLRMPSFDENTPSLICAVTIRGTHRNVSHLAQSLSIEHARNSYSMLLLSDEAPWLDLGLERSKSIGTAQT
jgi:hypothetical protein